MLYQPDVFYEMDVDDLLLAVKGFRDRRKEDMKTIRYATGLIRAAFISGRPDNLETMWAIDKEYKRVTQEDLDKRSAEILKRVQTMQAIEDQKKAKLN